MSIVAPADPVFLHAARLLILFRFCGTPRAGGHARRPGIKGRTLLAKLDFFLRYPAYLARAAQIRLRIDLDAAELGLDRIEDANTVESRMVRYRYGPWDHAYYVTLAYLIGKRLLTVELDARGTETFRLTPEGFVAAERLGSVPSNVDLITRAHLIQRVFPRATGSQLKDFIYNHFPDVVHRDFGATI